VASSRPSTAPKALELDDRQRQAVEHISGPLLVVAGAGTGKTTVLTLRIANLVRQSHARPEEILALTYTENAAAEMQQRARAELGAAGSGVRVQTFHAYCNNLLIGCGKSFRVLDDKDLWIFLRKRIRELELKHFVVAANVTKFLEDLLDFMRRCQDELVGPERYADYVARIERGELPIPRVCRSKHVDELSDQEVLARCQEISRVFTKVEAWLKEKNLGTFGHMITHAHALLTTDQELLTRERARIKFILVDEFQDANFAQVKILQKLSGTESNVFAVGDPDQAIYRFRGASSAAFELFQHAFPTANLITLDRNRRSTTPILKSAFGVIRVNPPVFGGKAGIKYQRAPLISARDEQAQREGKLLEQAPVEAVLLSGKEIESADLIRIMKETKRRTRCKWSDFAVLHRLHSHRDELVAEMAAENIPFSIEAMDVTNTSEVRDLFACLAAVVSDADDAALFRVSALPQFSIDPQKLRAGIRSLPREQEIGGVASVLTQIDSGPQVLSKVREVRAKIADQRARGKEAVEIVAREFNFDKTSPLMRAVLDFVATWEQKPIVETKELAEFLEYLELFREANGAIPLPSTEEDAVRVMTVHTAKGLEFKHVLLLRAYSPCFPSSYRESLVEFPRELRDPESIVEEDDEVLHKQEERRLFYVAMTRAKDSLTIYAKKGTGKDPTPAGFLREALKDTTLAKDLRQRPGIGFQTDIFGAASAPMTRSAEWLAMSPASDLSARLSASAVQRYETCPLQFKLEREWRIPGEPSAAMQYGGSIHRVLKAFFDTVKAGRPMSEQELIDVFRADLVDAKIQDSYQHDLYERQGIDQLRGFLEGYRKAPNLEVLHTEQFFEIKVDQSVVAGRIDRMDRLPDGRIIITDYKTGRPQSQEDADESLQLSVYALAAREKWGYEANKLVLYNLQENTSVNSIRTDVDLKQAKLKVSEVAQKVAEERFEPKPGFHCRFCAYHTLCPATEKRIYPLVELTQRSN
jgi:DNA helicase-2/ATP-dependent DNA helicase PcrA